MSEHNLNEVLKLLREEKEKLEHVNSDLLRRLESKEKELVFS